MELRELLLAMLIVVRDVKIALRAYEDTSRRLEKQEDEAAYTNFCAPATKERRSMRP